MTTKQARVGQQRPGGRAARVRSSVLKAVSELLAEVGYDQMTIEEIAKRAGVHKTTVYRRWSTKAELVLDTARAAGDTNIPVPNTGTFHGDLQEMARDVVANLVGSEQTTLAIVAAATASADLRPSMHTFWAERLSRTTEIIERAIKRGELPASADANLIVEAVIGPLWIRFLLTGETIDEDVADRVSAMIAKVAIDG